MGQSLVPGGIRLRRITYLTTNFDSLNRSFLKKGFRISGGKREPGGIFSNTITFPDHSEIILETTTSIDSSNWRSKILKRGTIISGIAFEADEIDSLLYYLQRSNIPLTILGNIQMERPDGSKYLAKAFALDSCGPLDVVFYSRDSLTDLQARDSLSNHPNHHFRFDWVLLSAGSSSEVRLRKIFDIINARTLHEGCCDYWRLGPSDDFCFFRFELSVSKATTNPNWLSIEPDGVYFAY